MVSLKIDIVRMLGKPGNYKSRIISHKDYPFNIQFLDLKNFLPPGSLDDNVRVWGGEVNKFKYPYESLLEENHLVELQRTDPHDQSEFFNTLTNENISDADYANYLVEFEKCSNSLDYLLRNNERDVEVMPGIIDQLIESNRLCGVDMLRCVSNSGCATQKKYNSFYEDFDMNASYADNPVTTFKVTPEFFKAMIKGYNSQDKKKHRSIANNITEKEYKEIKSIIEKGNC
jgi:hypothetical protein